MSRARTVPILSAVATFVVGCSSLPPRVEFRPDNDITPQCNVPGQTLDAAAWNAWKTELAALATEVGSDSADFSIVMDKLRWDVRYLAEGEGCTIQQYIAGHQPYDLKCGPLSRGQDAQRERLVTAMNTRVPTLIKLGESIRKCSSLPGFFSVEVGTAPLGGRGQCEMLADSKAGRQLTAATLIAGCHIQNIPACETGCKRNDPEACATLAMALSSTDQAASQEAALRGCELRVEAPSPDPKTLLVPCFGALSFGATSSPSATIVARGSAVADKVCAAFPNDTLCRGLALNPKSPMFSLERVRAMADRVGKDTNPALDRTWLLDDTAPYYDVARARAQVGRVEALTRSNPAEATAAAYLVQPKAPHYDAEVAKRVLAVMEASCAETSAPIPCMVAIRAHKRDGFAGSPLKALEIAKRTCETAPHEGCYQLVQCYEDGACGVPADAERLKSVYAGMCNRLVQKFPGADMSQTPDCKKASLAPRPAP